MINEPGSFRDPAGRIFIIKVKFIENFLVLAPKELIILQKMVY